jgi:hypothetical protein
MIDIQNIIYPHNSSILMSILGADIEYNHGQIVIEITEAKFCPDILLSYIVECVPSMGLTSNYWHISLNFSLNLASDLISALYRFANSLRLAWKLV